MALFLNLNVTWYFAVIQKQLYHVFYRNKPIRVILIFITIDMCVTCDALGGHAYSTRGARLHDRYISKMLPRINKPMGWLIYTYHCINKNGSRKVRQFYKIVLRNPFLVS